MQADLPPDQRLEPVEINQELTNGEVLAIAGGIEVIHAPGHCAAKWRFCGVRDECYSRVMCA